jgi:hypothetical protein
MKSPLVFAAMLSPVMLAQSSTDPPEGEKSEELATDRPGFTTPPPVLTQGAMQFETGFLLDSTRAEAGRDHSLVLGIPLFRVGMGHRFELRLAEGGFEVVSPLVQQATGVANLKSEGWQDIGIGAKISVLDQNGRGPAIALLPGLSLPTGNRGFTSANYDPSLGIAWSEGVGRFSLNGTVTLAAISLGPERTFGRSSATSLWSPAVRGFTGFCEIYVSIPGGTDSSFWIVDGGITRAVGRRAQIDFEVGRGLTHAAPVWSVSGGYVFRYDLPHGRLRSLPTR